MLCMASRCFRRCQRSAYSWTNPAATRSRSVSMLSPSISRPSLLTKRAKRFKCLAGHSALVQRSVLVPLLLMETSVAALQTGHVWGTVKTPVFSFTATHFGIILFDLMISRIVFPSSPIPRRSISLILTSEALLTVVPSS